MTALVVLIGMVAVGICWMLAWRNTDAIKAWFKKWF